jgi:superkiller protein 3
MLKSKSDVFEHNAVIKDAIGQLLVGKRRYAEAISYLRQASLLTTDDTNVKEHLALALYYNKDYREAGDMLSRIVKEDRNKDRIDLYLALADCYSNSGREVDAKSAYETVTQISPGTAEAWTSLARIALEHNDLRRAESSIKRAVALDPSGSESQLLLGYVRLRQNRLTEALPAFKKASALNQKDTVSLCMIGYVYEKTGKNDLAIQCYAKALKIRPADPLATKLLAGIDPNQ